VTVALYPPHRVTTLLVPPAEEPLTLAQAKLRACLDWPEGDPRDSLMDELIAAARDLVQLDTGVALLTQTYAVRYDVIAAGETVILPWRPVQTVVVRYSDQGGLEQVLAPADYRLDPASAAPAPARLQLLGWPSDHAPLAGWTIETVVGHVSVDAFRAAAPGLHQALGLLTTHYATAGRDLAVIGTNVSTIPLGYDEAVAPYQLVTLI
jgi:uncharacterized phiE125 gp8 family phage protein